MSCVRSVHTWRCDGCGKEQQLEHGEWAEPALPEGWWHAFGWDAHACSKACVDRAEEAFNARFPPKVPSARMLIWSEPKQPNLGFIHRPVEPRSPATGVPFSETP